MAIPDYQSLMLPVLKLHSDGKERKFSSAIEELADEFIGNRDLFPIAHSNRRHLTIEGIAA